MMKKYLYILLLLFPVQIWAQNAPMKSKRIPVDTLVTKDGLAKVVIFSNGTWTYLSSTQAPVESSEDEIIDIRNAEEQNLNLDSEIFQKNWSEGTIASYSTTLSDLPACVTLTLAGDSLLFCCPYTGTISSRYGYRRGRRHTGLDLSLKTGDPIYAAFDGKVRASMYNSGGYGHLVILRHANGLETYYGHLSKRLVDVGEVVHAGDVIGLGGSTGRSTGPHLHFETRYEGFPFDPERIIDFSSGKLRNEKFDLRKSYFGANSRYAASGNYDPSRGDDDEDAEEAAAKPAPKPTTVYHTVRSGENLSKIAGKYGTTVSAIGKLNKIDVKKPIRVGQKLRVK